MKNQSLKNAFIISIIYFLLGLLWIYFSDIAVASIASDHHQLTHLQTYKGWFFIIVTGIILFFLSHRFLQKEFVTYLHHINEQKVIENQLIQKDALLNTIINSTSDAIFVKDLEGKYILFNKGASNIMGLSSEEAIGKNDDNIFSSQDAKKIRLFDKQIIDEGVISSHEESVTTSAGQSKVFYVTKGPIRTLDERISGVFGISRDITEQKSYELDLLKQQAILESIAEGVYAIDNENRCNYINSVALNLLGINEKDIIGKSPHDVFHSHHLHRENYAPDECPIRNAVLQGSSAKLEDIFMRRDETLFPVYVTVSPILLNELLLGSVVTFIDISDQKISQEKLEAQKEHFNHLAHHDPLTKLPNRLILLETLETLTTSENKEPFALMFLDLDGFKEINDSYGHRFGDQILIQFAQLLEESFTHETAIVRTGGDEFVIILSCHGNKELMIHSIRQLIDKLNTPFSINGMEIYITASIGVALYPEHSSSADGLLQQADAAMYNAKNLGKNTYSFYDVNFTEQALRRTTVATNLKKALSDNTLELYFQPQVDSHSGKIIGAEALLRWPTPEGMISPSLFIPIAEESGLIIDVGEFVLYQGCKIASKWSSSGILRGRIAINVSVRQITHIDFITTLDRIIQETQCHPEWIELEITESSILEYPEKIITLLSVLKNKGFKISIDDFGTGYSSLSYLKNLPIDKLKIDITFVRNITHEPKNQTIVKTIIALAKGLQMSVIAEGVETQEELEFMRHNDVDSIQGYYFHKPMNLEAVEELLREES